jgi:hypothetical protein
MRRFVLSVSVLSVLLLGFGQETPAQAAPVRAEASVIKLYPSQIKRVGKRQIGCATRNRSVNLKVGFQVRAGAYIVRCLKRPKPKPIPAPNCEPGYFIDGTECVAETIAVTPPPAPPPPPPPPAPLPPPWAPPAGFTMWTGAGYYSANQSGFQFSNPTCGVYADGCWGVNVVTATNCSSLFIKLDLLDANGNYVAWSIDSQSSVPAGQIVYFGSDEYHPEATQFLITSIDCFHNF